MYSGGNIQTIGEILPPTLEHIQENNIDFIKRRAAEYADMFVRDGSFAAAYKQDYDSGTITDGQAVTVIQLANVYIAVKNGTYTRSQGVQKQKEILNAFFSPPDSPKTKLL